MRATMILALTVFLSQIFALDQILTVRDHYNIARTGEPVATGIPLPKGAYKSTRYFKIEGASNYQFQTLMVWPDSSIRWMLAQFFVDAAAGRPSMYHLRDNNNGTLPSSTLSVTEDNVFVNVNTGPLQFKVKKSGGFNLFDEVVLNGTQLVAPSNENGVRITAKYNNMVYKSAGNDTTYQVAEIGRAHV